MKFSTIKRILLIHIIGSWLYGNKLKRPEGLFIQLGHNFAVTSVAFTPDGKEVLSASVDKNLKLWEKKNGNVIRTFGYIRVLLIRLS